MNRLGWIVLVGLLVVVVAAVYFGADLFAPAVPAKSRPGTPTQTPAELPEGDPARENHKALSEVDLASYLPPLSERSGLDATTNSALELLESWCNQAKRTAWPSVVVVVSDKRQSPQERVLQVAFAKTLRVRVTAVVDEPPTVELAAADGAQPVVVQLGDKGVTPLQPYADVTSVYRAFETIERLRRVQFVATAEPLLDWIDLETGIASVHRTDDKAPNAAGAVFRVEFQSQAHVLTLKLKGPKWQIQRIKPGS